ncbi:MAG TPA: D-aminoacyl-tRNA deacylase [Candidatus Sulfotelmatobacter sp.]|nr:D-aminoacyl-tRNA deacylase [Candidatus Sulfotelmatobacter sp.]
MLLQRVLRASVRVEGQVVGSCGPGLLVLLGVGRDDDAALAASAAARVADLRIFRDEAGRTNLSLLETGGQALVVSQFTLYADTRKGRRPSFLDAAPPDAAIPLYEAFVAALEARGVTVGRGVFGAEMEVELVNDGPMTVWLDSQAREADRLG